MGFDNASYCSIDR
jgi:aldose 1-epimerase